jgi:hypothetical protein
MRITRDHRVMTNVELQLRRDDRQNCPDLSYDIANSSFPPKLSM